MHSDAVRAHPQALMGMSDAMRAAHVELKRFLYEHVYRHQRVLRQVGIGGQILADLNIRKIRLLSNTPMHIPALEGFGLEIVEQVPIPVATLAPACT